MLSPEERKIAQMFLTSPMAQGLSTMQIAGVLGVRNDEAAYKLCQMRQKGFVFTKTSECKSAGYSVWHMTDHFNQTCILETSKPKIKPEPQKVHTYILQTLNNFDKIVIGTKERAMAEAKIRARNIGPCTVLQKIGVMRYIPPMPVEGKYELE